MMARITYEMRAKKFNSTNIFLAVSTLLLLLAGCSKEEPSPFGPTAPPPPDPVGRIASLGIVGDTNNVNTTTKGGVVIMGGSTDVDAAFRWMIDRSGGGDVVIIRASGTDAYNSYVNKLGKVNSVETLKIDSRKLAEDEGVAKVIRDAEMLFIAGGDQSDYTENWKNTKTMEAINYLLQVKKVPVGGTSAGAAILGNYYYSGERGSVTSAQALANPFSRDITLYQNDFLKAPFLENIITDQHFSQREREGRTFVFLARIMTDWEQAPMAIAVDEKTAVCIDESGIAEVVGENQATFLKTFADKKPEILATDQPITWSWSGKAVQAWQISGKAAGNRFDVAAFEPKSATGITNWWWSATAGKINFMSN